MDTCNTSTSKANEHSPTETNPRQTMSDTAAPLHHPSPQAPTQVTASEATPDRHTGSPSASTSVNETPPICDTITTNLNASETSDVIIYLITFFQRISILQQIIASLIHALVTGKREAVTSLKEECVKLVRSASEVLNAACRSSTGLSNPVATVEEEEHNAPPRSASPSTSTQLTETRNPTDSSSHIS
ncbi:unnamed protein product [Hydatigera taeniaeformis]|uniref:Uncharacterized protein n=1 Tax=Hydatigena taeniaeformis TaxID=6205 RepID=A0A0R3WS51_HYDTA|nr:unnamed protein product [Hydatigera taeniaeformis]